MLDESRKFSVPRGSPSPCVHSGQVPILPLHLALPGKVMVEERGSKRTSGSSRGKVGTEQAVMTVLRRSVALFLPNHLFASIISLPAPRLCHALKNKTENRPNYY